jgi:hypothetical protein
MKCPGCGIELSARESKSGCPLCDWTPEQAARLQANTAERRQMRTEAIAAEIASNPQAKFVKRLAAYLIEQYRYEVPCWATNPLVMRNIRGATHAVYNGQHQIAFGWQCMEEEFERGFNWKLKEYRHLFDTSAKGYKALYQVVVHEFAHALQRERGGRWYGSQHNVYWADAVCEVFALVPFEDVAHLAA